MLMQVNIKADILDVPLVLDYKQEWKLISRDLIWQSHSPPGIAMVGTYIYYLYSDTYKELRL